MSVPSAYLAVIFIWTTTPLGIVWSSQSYDPSLAALLRMAIAASVGWVLLRLLKIELPWHAAAFKSYGYSILGVFFALYCTYQAAAYIPSGMISLLYGLTPILSGLLGQRLLKEDGFSVLQWAALLLALLGLLVVCSDNLLIQSRALPSVALLLLAVLTFSFSSVMVKKCALAINPLAFSVGGMLCSLPFFTVAWLFQGAPLPAVVALDRSAAAILYLALMGSLLGFMAYYFLLERLSASSVALITLLTPVLALALGVLLNNEQLGLKLIMGSGFIIVGLSLFQAKNFLAWVRN